MKLTATPLAVILFVVLFGGIGLSSAMNWWQTESQKVPVVYKEGQAAGQYDPADIRGSYTFGEVNELFAVPLADLQAAFRLTGETEPASFQLKSLEALYAGLPVEVGTASVRMFVAFYKGLPYDLANVEETFLFPEAVDILKAQGRLQPEQAAYLDLHVVPSEPIGSTTDMLSPTSTEATGAAQSAGTESKLEDHAAPEKTVTGKTTFQDLLDWGVSQDKIEQILGESMPPFQTLIKDYYSQKGEAFSSGKSVLQAEVDALK